MWCIYNCDSCGLRQILMRVAVSVHYARGLMIYTMHACCEAGAVMYACCSFYMHTDRKVGTHARLRSGLQLLTDSAPFLLVLVAQSDSGFRVLNSDMAAAHSIG